LYRHDNSDNKTLLMYERGIVWKTPGNSDAIIPFSETSVRLEPGKNALHIETV
jgi:hypothetical protein